MPKFRVCKRFTVESGHMLSLHPEACRYPHGHTRTIEVVIAANQLDKNGMVLDFKALSLAVKPFVNQFDHSMAINSNDPLRASIESIYPGSTVVFENEDPTTEVLAKKIFEFVQDLLKSGWKSVDGLYSIPAKATVLERVRVWETPSSWAECSEG